MNKFKIISFYAFIHLDDLQFISEIIKNECKKSKIAGLVILAKEGINGTLSGLENDIYKFNNFPFYNKIEIITDNQKVKKSKFFHIEIIR